MISLLAESLHSMTRRAQEGERREHHQSEQLRVTLESIGDAVIATDAEGRVTYVNPVGKLVGLQLSTGEKSPLRPSFQYRE